MLSGVPGLLTFTMVSDEVLESTAELPSLVHVILGSGLPDALHVSDTLLPSCTISAVLEMSTDGATKGQHVTKRKSILGTQCTE